MKLGEKIQYCRKKAGMSQDVLAEKIGVSRQAISKWELGEALPEISNLAALAKEFGVSVDWLISEEGELNNTPEKEGENYEKKYDAFFDSWTGFAGRMLKRFGWLAGVYLALGGLGMFVIGLLAKFALLAMSNSFNSTISSMNGFVGNASAMPNITNNIVANNPVFIMASFFMIVGFIMMIGGTVLAIYLRKKGRK